MDKSWHLRGVTKQIVQYLSVVLIAATFFIGCGGSGSGSSSGSDTAEQAAYVYQKPVNLNDGWQVDHVANQGVDEIILTELVNNIQDNLDQFRYIDAVLVAKNGYLLLNEQFKTELDFTDGWANNSNIDLHILNSVSKSFTSTLVGIAIDQQLITDTNVLVHDYFQHKHPIAEWSESKANITLQNWLTMQHGYEWDEWDVSYFDANNLNAQMNNSVDPMQFLLDRPMVETPGNVFSYSTGVSFALGRLVERASGQSLVSFMENNLLTPLSIDNYTYWSLDNTPHMGSALYLSTRDLV